jgi:hypothetical protein
VKHELPEADKEVFRAASVRRREAGIRLKRVSITMSQEQVEAWYIAYDALVETVGKNKTVDGIILMMARWVAKLRDKERENAGLHS